MGRGRGKGKKLTLVTSHEDPDSGDEVLPAYKKRGRPHKPLKEDFNEEKIGKLEEGGDVKPAILEKEVKGHIVPENGKKRKTSSEVQENSNSALEENGVKVRSNSDDSTRSNGFRQNGSRRKSTPRRAAEAGVECM
uniref:Adenine deaminase n=1 Tax=Anthurium amnicola TaxID=1678845 RepID=A0A1D1XJN0_9ARAE